MKDVFYHASGMCGEHWHPNAINVTFLILCACLVYRQVHSTHRKKK